MGLFEWFGDPKWRLKCPYLTNSTKNMFWNRSLFSTNRKSSIPITVPGISVWYRSPLFSHSVESVASKWNQWLRLHEHRGKCMRTNWTSSSYVGYQRKCNGKHANGNHGEWFVTRRQTASWLSIRFLCFVINCSKVHVPHATLCSAAAPPPSLPNPSWPLFFYCL